jgi:pimeloyl-ACP methyl ester carboxylesterase
MITNSGFLALLAFAEIVLFGCSTSNGEQPQLLLADSGKPSKIWRQAIDSDEIMPFASEGPIQYREILDHDFRLGLDHIVKVNIALPTGIESAPLAIIQHGNMSFKEAHLEQMRRLASWGFAVLTPQMPNFGKWQKNGDEIKSMVELIYKWPKLISPQINPQKIILVGHSFGGSAVSLAAAKGAPIAGLILLDPALYSRNVLKSLSGVRVPTFVLAADPKFFFAKKRPSFFAEIRSRVTELVISDTTHDDAQLPSLNSLRFFGFDPTTSEEGQARFLNSMITAAASIADPNILPLSWNSFRRGMRAGLYIEAKRK